MNEAKKSIVTESLERGYETTDATPRPLVIFVIGLVLVTVLCMGVSRLIEDGLVAGRAANEVEPHPLAETNPSEPPAPRLQDKPLEDIREHRAIEARLLENYEWIDKEGDVVRIPIERAMQLYAEREGGR